MTTQPRKKNPRSPAVRPWHPAYFTIDDVYAVQAVAKGKANEVQQKRALGWIINTAAATYETEFVPDSDRESAFASGKRHLGLQIVKLVNLPQIAIDALRLSEGKPPSPPKEGSDNE